MAFFEDNTQRWVVGIGGVAVERAETGVIVTYALGSCLGIAAWDQLARVGGLLHAQMPVASRNPELARSEPGRFVDSGLDLLLVRMQAVGAERRRLRITVAGAANMNGTANPLFDISRQNLTALRRELWRLGLLVAGEDVGGEAPRTMSLDLATGTTVVRIGAERKTL